MTDTELTQELEKLNGAGYFVQEDAFTSEEIYEMRCEADRVLELLVNSSLANRRTSKRLDLRLLPSGAQVVRKIQPVNDLSLRFSIIARDHRILDPLRHYMADEPELIEEKISYKQHLPAPVVGIDVIHAEDRFFAHSDWAYHREHGYPPRTINVGIALDDCPPDSGPLRVWPGTHKVQMPHEIVGRSYIVPDHLLDPYESRAIIVRSGAVIFFHGLLVHASGPNKSRRARRVIFFSYMPRSVTVGFDLRNGPTRFQESPYEWNYHAMQREGLYKDCFSAPKY